MGFLFSCLHCTFSNFNHIMKTDLFQCAIHMIYIGIELSENSRSYYCNNFFSEMNFLKDVKSMRRTEDCTKRTSDHTFSAIDTLILINMLNATFIFTDSFYRASFLTWDRNIHNRMIRTTLMTNTTTYAHIMVNPCFSCFCANMYRIFRAVILTTTSDTSST